MQTVNFVMYSTIGGGGTSDSKHNAEAVFQTFLPWWSDMLDNRFAVEAVSTFVGTKTCVELTSSFSSCSI